MPLLIGYDICSEDCWGSHHLIYDNCWFLELYFTLLSEGISLACDESCPEHYRCNKSFTQVNFFWGMIFVFSDLCPTCPLSIFPQILMLAERSIGWIKKSIIQSFQSIFYFMAQENLTEKMARLNQSSIMWFEKFYQFLTTNWFVSKLHFALDWLEMSITKVSDF